jgi:hypothetical protein
VNVTESLRDLVADEPPFVLRPDEVIAAGRRRSRVRTLTALGTGGVAVTALVTGLALVGGSGGGRSSTVRLGGQPTAGAADTGDTTSVYYRIARAHTPAGWTINHAFVEEASGWWADVDDGSHGPGRIGMFRSTGSLQQHPCSDSEFVAKATSCTETMLDADTRLIVRSVSHTNPINDIQVVIVHADGSGVNVSDDNAVFPDPRDFPPIVTPAQKRALNTGTVGSPEPLYSTDQLVAMAKALDATSR